MTSADVARRGRRAACWLTTALLASLSMLACGGGQATSSGGSGGTGGGGTREVPEAQADPDRDLLATQLTVDVSRKGSSATVAFVPGPAGGLTLEIGDLSIVSVRDSQSELNFRDNGNTLDIGIPANVGEVTIAYQYLNHEQFDGAMSNGLTFSWPYYCGNLFPCKSTPADGLQLGLELNGLAAGQTAVFPSKITAQAPSYMLAWAIGEYSYQALGTTSSGIELGYYSLPGGETAASNGTKYLLASFEWLEQTLGPYLYGNKAAAVAAPWGAGAFGGMEHHPLWHVSSASMSDPKTHAHEAAHGWFGNGVRIACWEDFVLSEGTVSYLAARALEATAGQALADATWTNYRSQLDGKIAWPTGCGQVDILKDGLYSSAPYVKGALFYKSLEAKVGRAALDAALRSFYQNGREQARTMQDLLDHVQATTGYDPAACADAWLRQSAVPSAELCP